MQIEYQRSGYKQTHTERESINEWVKGNLGKPGIEKQISKVHELLSLITKQWLEDHPDKLERVAYIIDCEGYDHKLVQEE